MPSTLNHPSAIPAFSSNNLSQSVAPVLTEAIQAAVIEARAACEQNGVESSQCAVAWEVVEELQAERCHLRQRNQHQETAFERYCNENPDAAECRVYDV